jgi:hypothetical protein
MGLQLIGATPASVAAETAARIAADALKQDAATAATDAELAAEVAIVNGSLLTTGEATFPRWLINNVTSALTSQIWRIAFFTARKTETITQVSFVQGSVAAGATPSLVRYGIYSVAGNGDCTLINSTVNDTSLLAAAAGARSTKALSSSFSKVKGTRYGVAVLVVTAATTPQIAAVTPLSAIELGKLPRLVGYQTGQADLPASVTEAAMAGVTQTTVIPYAVLEP